MWSNWSRGQTCTPAEHVRPGSRAELAAAVARGRAVRVAGAGHSFSGGVATDGTLLSLERLDRVLDVDRASGLVRAEAGISLRRLVRELHGHGLALPNLGDIDAQSLAGALATGTHGTGVRLGNLSTAVAGMELVLADGSERVLEGGDELLAARVGLGALGVVAAVTLRCVPAFRLHAVDEPRPLEDVLSELDAHVEANDHFELFTFPHSPLALTRTNNRTEAPASPRRPRLEWLQDVAMDNHAFGLINRAARRLPRAIPALNRLAGRVGVRAASASPSPSRCSRARGWCASRRWSTRCRGRAPPRRCGRAARSSPATRCRSRSSCASPPATTRCSRPRTGARPPTSPCTCSRGWSTRRRSARSRRCCAAGTAGRTGASAPSSPRRSSRRATRAGATSPRSASGSTPAGASSTPGSRARSAPP